MVNVPGDIGIFSACATPPAPPPPPPSRCPPAPPPITRTLISDPAETESGAGVD